MSCTNPNLMLVVNFSTYAEFAILKEHGWKCNWKTHKAYRLASKDSRAFLIESLPKAMSNRKLSNQRCETFGGEAPQATNEPYVIEQPCGNCINCRLDYSKMWASRCSLEASQHLYNYCITLTYDDDVLPVGKFGNPTLLKKDFQDFIKNLRQIFQRKYGFTGIRYFGCGEYGELGRPHFHIVLFNCPFKDLTINLRDKHGKVIQKKDKRGVYYRFSEDAFQAWNEKGFITIQDGNYDTSAYVSRYVLKKQKGQNKKIYDDFGIEPPFLLMSRRPGIGEAYFTEHYEDLKEAPTLFVGRQDGEPLKLGVPRYFKKKLKDKEPNFYEEKFVQHAIETSEAFASLMKGKQLINEHRRVVEEKTKANLQAKKRTL